MGSLVDVTCQSCRATYKVDDAKIPAQGIKAKCPKCGHSFLLKKPSDDDVIAVGGDTSAPAADPPPPSDPFAGFGAAPIPDMGMGASPPDPFGAAPAGADPFAGGFGGSAPAADPFAGGFGGGGFGSGGFDTSGGAAPQGAPDIGGLFQAKTAFEVKRADGEKIGPFDLFTIKQMIYEGQLNGSEQLLDASSNWVAITTVEDLGEIFRLTGAQPAADGGSQWGGQPEAPKAGWVKHESAAPAPAPAPVAAPAAPMPAKGARPASAPAAVPAAPVALDKGRGRGAGERAIILTEGIWSLAKTRGARIAFVVLVALVVLGGLGYQFRWQLARIVGLAGPIEAAALVTEGDRTLASGERGPMLNALARYDEALRKYPKSADAQARAAEVASGIWHRDPPRLDMKSKAEASLAAAVARDPEAYSVVRAQARVALAKGDVAAAEAAIAKAGALPEGAADPILAAIRADVLFEKGDTVAAEAAYSQVKQASPATTAHGAFGIALLKLHAKDFGGAKLPLEEALRLEPENGTGRAMAAYLSANTGGDLAAARKTLRELAASPSRFGIERSRASYYLGLLSEEAGLPSPALHHMRDAVRYYPSHKEAIAAAKRLFATRFESVPADAWLANVSRVRGSTVMDKVQTAEIELERRNWQAALSPLVSATQEDTVNARPQYVLGLLLVEVSEAEKAKAKANFERAMAVDPEWADPVIALSRWQLDAKAIPEARTLGNQAVQLDPTLPDAYRVVAAGAMAAKDYAAAQESLQLAVEFDPEDYVSWLDLGEARRLGGNAQEAIPAVEKAAALRPELAEPRIRLGAVYEALGDLAKANEFYVEAAKIDPANLTIATRAGVIDARQANYVEARKRLEAVVKAQPANGEAQYWLGIAHHQTGEPEKALDSYKAAVKADYFDKYLSHWHMGEILGGPGSIRDVDAARDQLNKCLTLKPEHFQCLEEQAKIASSENQYDDAIKLLKSVETSIAKLPASQKDPVIVRVVLQQGKIAKSQGKTRDAEVLFRKVLKQDPKNAEVMWNLGQLVSDNDSRAAKDWYLKAIRGNDAYAPPYRDLAYILKEEGNDCGAKKNFELFLVRTPSEKEKKPVEDELQSLTCEK